MRFSGRLGQPFQCFKILGNKRGIQHQIPRRIARERQFRRHHDVRAGGNGAFIGGEDFCRVAGNVADDGVDLRQGCSHGRPAYEPWR